MYCVSGLYFCFSIFNLINTHIMQRQLNISEHLEQGFERSINSIIGVQWEPENSLVHQSSGKRHLSAPSGRDFPVLTELQ